MIKDKKGMSGIIVTIIMIALVLVAIAIVWGLVINLVGQQQDRVERSEQCVGLGLEIRNAACSDTNPSLCNLTMRRQGATSQDPAGIKVVFVGEGGNSSDSSEFGTITQLQTKTLEDIDSGITDIVRVEVTPYFLDETGNQDNCNTLSRNF